VNLREDQVHHAVEQLLLVGDVVVKRHRAGIELSTQPAHAERFDALVVGESEGLAHDALLAQRDRSSWA